MSSTIIPVSKHDVNIRVATMADVPFIDALQKKFGKQLGFMKMPWLIPRIEKGEVLIAEGMGYIISVDKYNKREDCGLIVQLCVDPTKQRGLVGAMLVKAAFERAAYGCKLFCLWCAQDIAANHFWEAIGFVPLAFRAGSEKKVRTHIFWQKRIREGDVSTPWWFPSQTTGGAMGAPRLVFPIPGDRHWSDELPLILPQTEPEKTLPAPRKPKAPAVTAPPKRGGVSRSQTLFFTSPAPAKPEPVEKPKREKKKKAKNDPKLIAMARELRDRWLEKVNDAGLLIESQGKYDVARTLPGPQAPQLPSPTKFLPAA